MLSVIAHLFFFTVVIGASQGASPDVLKKDHQTLDDCAKACLEETSMNCKYFKFTNATGTCYLSAKDHPDFSNYDKKAEATTKPPPPKSRKKQPTTHKPGVKKEKKGKKKGKTKVLPSPDLKKTKETVEELQKKISGIQNKLDELKVEPACSSC